MDARSDLIASFERVTTSSVGRAGRGIVHRSTAACTAAGSLQNPRVGAACVDDDVELLRRSADGDWRKDCAVTLRAGKESEHTTLIPLYESQTHGSPLALTSSTLAVKSPTGFAVLREPAAAAAGRTKAAPPKATKVSSEDFMLTSLKMIASDEW